MARIRDRYDLDIDTSDASRSLTAIRTALGALAGAFAISEIADFTRDIVAATTEYERYQTILTTSLGSQRAANAALADLKVIARSIPQDLQDLTDAFIVLNRNGIDTSADNLKAFANIAVASGKSLEQLGEALGDAFRNEFERLKEFGINVSREGDKLVASIGGDIVAISDSSKDLVEQLTELGNTRFSGASEANAKTLSQSLSNLRGSVFEVSVAFGQGLTPALKQIADDLNEVLLANEELARSLGGDTGDAILSLAESIKTVSSFVSEFRVLLIALASTALIPYIRGIAISIRLVIIALLTSVAPLRAFGVLLLDIGRGIPLIGRVVAGLAALGPIGLTVAAALIGASVALVVFQDELVQVGDTTTTVGELTRATGRIIVDFAGKAGVAIKEGLGDAFDFVVLKLQEFKEEWGPTFRDIASVVKDNINETINVFRALFMQITVGITDLPKIWLQSLVASFNLISAFGDSVVGVFGEIWDFIASAGDDAFENTFANLGDVFEKEVAKIGGQSSIDWEGIMATDNFALASDAIRDGVETLIKVYGDAATAAKDFDLTNIVDGMMANLGEAAAERELDRLAKKKKLLEDIASISSQELGIQKAQLSSLNLATDAFIAQYREKTRLLGLSEDERDIQETIAQARLGLETMLAPLIARRGELEKDNGEVAKAQLVILNQTIAALKEQFNIAIPGIRGMVEARQAELDIQEQLLATEDLRKGLAQQIAEIQGRSKTAKENTQLEGLTGIRRELKEIELQENRAAEAAKARLKEQFSGADTTALRNALKEIDAATSESIRVQQTLAQQSYENARAFSTGWKNAFDEYKDNASDAAKTAQRLFETSTQGIEDAIVGFVKTGKFEFGDLVDTILEQLLRAQLQQLIANTFGVIGGIGGGGGIGGAISAGFNAFAGMFGNGGTIPAGQFGIVGERGPEMVKGPAYVTPGASGSNVTYHINAVDASSFKQMIARDPEFLYAVTERGKRSMPQTRR